MDEAWVGFRTIRKGGRTNERTNEGTLPRTHNPRWPHERKTFLNRTPSRPPYKSNPFPVTVSPARLWHPLQHLVHLKMYIGFTFWWREGRAGRDEPLTNFFSWNAVIVLYLNEFWKKKSLCDRVHRNIGKESGNTRSAVNKLRFRNERWEPEQRNCLIYQ